MFSPFTSREPYIHPEARASYIHFWKREASRLWLWYPEARRGPYKYTYRRYVRPWDVSTSGESTFVQKGYSKKTKNQTKEDWREYKQFARDKAKAGSVMDGCPPWLKRQCNKDYRQWVRQCIHREQFDLVGSKTRKDFFDPWMWD